MSRNITNYIQKIWTELSNMVIFCTNIRIRFRYILYLNILGSYTSKPNSSILRRTQLKSTHNFIIFKQSLIKKNDTRKEQPVPKWITNVHAYLIL